MFSILRGYSGHVYNEATDEWVDMSKQEILFAKVFTQAGSKPASLPSKFTLVEEVEPKSLEEAFKLVKRLASDPHVVAVRGRKRIPGETFRRNSANFDTSVPSTILAMDVDNMPLPKGMDGLDIKVQAEYVCGILHSISEEMFPLGMGYIAHASSSAGIKPNIRMHLILECNIPVTQGQIKYALAEVNRTCMIKHKFDIADMAYYSSTQLHYFADPLFKDGLEDPFWSSDKPRLVFNKGAKVVLPADLPDFAVKKVTFEPKMFELLTHIRGMHNTTEELEDTIRELEEATDGVYLRIIPKLYHRALGAGISLDYLEREIRPALELYIKEKSNSNRNIQDYFNNGRRECVKAFIANSKRDIAANIKGINVTDVKTASTFDNPFLSFSGLPPPNTLSFVKASLGTGKTTAIIKWLKMGMIEGGFLAITNTRALVSSNAKKFEAGQYDKAVDMVGFKQGKVTRMSTTIHSLHKFKSMVDKIDFVFIDEADAVMNDLLFSPVVKQRAQCAQVLYDILRQAKYVVLSDGDISSETVEAYGSLIEFEKPVAAYRHHRRMLHNANAFEFPDESSIWVAMQTSLEMGEKCILVSDCGPPELGEKGIALRNSTGCIIKEIHSASTADEDIKRILDYTTDELVAQQIDGLLCSPSVTSGVDFNYFDNVFVITRSGNQTPNMRFQAIRRDRGAQNIFYYTDKATSGFMAGSDQFQIQQGWMEKAQHIFARRRELESRNYASTLRYYLVDQGATIEVFSESWGKIDSAAEEYNEERINAILASTAEFSPPRHNDAYEAKLMLVQYYHLDSINDVTRELVEQFVSEKPHQRAEFFHKIHPIFWNAIKECTADKFFPFIEAMKKHKKDFFMATGQSANPKYARMYLGKCGIKDPQNTDHIVDWYRTYCKMESIQIPWIFMTEEERSMAEEAGSELGATREQVEHS